MLDISSLEKTCDNTSSVPSSVCPTYGPGQRVCDVTLVSVHYFENPVLLGEEPWACTKYLEGNKDFVITYIKITRYKELTYVLRFVKVYCATLKMTRYEQWCCCSPIPYIRNISILRVTFIQYFFVDFNVWLCFPKNGLDSEIALYYLLMTIDHSNNNSYKNMKLNFAHTVNLYANCFTYTLLIAPYNCYRLSYVWGRTPKVYVQVK
jgi:hypothetical protein